MTEATLGQDSPARPSATAAQAAVNWSHLFLGFGGMVIGQFMSILDIQIVAASLPQIQAGVGASADQVSWVQTAYLIPEVVMIPLSAYLSRLWGTQRVFLVSCGGFLLMSVLAGLSTSVDMLIVCRALQGFVGGAMIPTVFATAFTAFPPERRVTANVITGMIVTLAPTVGPTFGGHLTEWLNWRWLFFINVGPGLLSLFLVARFANFDRGNPKLSIGFDWFGLATMAVFLMSLQYVMEEGTKNSWFKDDLIIWLSVATSCCGAIFIWRQLTYHQPIIQLKAFRDRNFALGFVMTAVSGTGLYGGTFLLPLFLGRVRGFSAAEVGTTMLVSGLTMFFTGPLIGRYLRYVDARVPMVFGFTLSGLGMWTGHEITGDWGFWQFAGLQMYRGVGTMMAMIATSQMSMSTLPSGLIKDASGLVNLARNIGGALALAVLSSTIARETFVHMSDLSARVSQGDARARGMLTGLTERMAQLGLADPDGAARKAFHFMLHKQAEILAFGDAFSLLAIAGFVAALLALFARPGRAPVAQVTESH